MTARQHAHQPRLRRYGRPLVRVTQSPPDRATDDIKACIVAFTVFLLLVIASSLQGPALRPIDRHPVPSPVVWRMPGVSR